ncbi:MAG: ATP synthase subunit C [Spirochaetia bacterium]|jgi:V/A-type H+-transporting ATPase subunit K|nr:ATP synthase subunit C [Spirochaetia bacterium]
MTKIAFKRKVSLSFIATFLMLIASGFLFAPGAFAAGTTTAAASSSVGIVCLAAAISFGCGAIAAGFAIAHVGAAAMGAISEKPEIASQALIFIALAEGLVIFGFIIALMILGHV